MATILCVEDEAHLREDIVEDLQDAGHETYQARDGQEGLQMILRHKPDVVISDISMPRMDGRQLVGKLRSEHPEYSDMPFIFLTAFTDKKDVLDGLKIGADDYLTKPVDYELLQIKVATLLRQTGRMIDRRQQEQVKLYKALSKEDSNTEPAPEPTYDIPAHSFVLVGESDNGLWNIQRQLEDLGQSVHVFTSGRSFLDKVDMLSADVVMLWLQSDDMQAPMIATLTKSKQMKTVVVLPASMKGPMIPQKMNGVLDLVALPLTTEDLVGKIKTWLDC